MAWLVVGTFAGLLVLAYLVSEWQYRHRLGNGLTLDWGLCQFEIYEPHHYQLLVEYTATNITPNRDVFIVEVHPHLTLLSDGSLNSVVTHVQTFSKHPDAPPRQDGYWESYIVKAKRQTQFEVYIDIRGNNLYELRSLWLRLEYVVYGPAGRETRYRHTIVPLKFPRPTPTLPWQTTPQADVLPIRTHLLTTADDPVSVLKRYVVEYAQTGDIVAFAESPIAIMQGRFIHPSEVHPGWLAKRLCYYFMPTSSLATLCGLQVLVDQVGAWRVFFAFVVGGLAKVLFGQGGVFYQLAGEQARLIDDVTGTLPPYDQFIVLGPEQPQKVVEDIKAQTGLEVAIVDVNDLKRVKVLAATAGVSESLLNAVLIDNPAGNAAEQTPIVLIRPHKKDEEKTA